MSKSRVARVLLMAALMAHGCWGGADSNTPPAPVRPVRAMRVGDIKALTGREFPGRARAKGEVELSFQVSGPLVSLPVDVGMDVNKGDLIAAIDPRDFEAELQSHEANLERARANLLAMESGARPEEIEQLKAAVRQAEATYRQAKAEHERNTVLLKSKTIPQADFDISLARAERTAAEVEKAQEALNIGIKGARPEDLEAKRSEIRALQAAVAAAKNQLDYTILSAPFAGEVASRFVDNFQTVQAKQPIVRLLDVSKIEVTLQIPESLIALVPQVGDAVCRFDAFPSREFIGTVTKIGSEASQTTRTYPVTVQIDQPEDVRILPGMAATVRGRPKENNNPAGPALIVPSDAVFTGEAGQQTFVWVVDEQTKTVARRAVKVGDLTQAGLTIVEGLTPGEWVVISGVNSLRDDQEVRLLR